MVKGIGIVVVRALEFVMVKALEFGMVRALEFGMVRALEFVMVKGNGICEPKPEPQLLSAFGWPYEIGIPFQGKS